MYDQSIRKPARDLYYVVALRVEFQPDTTRFTTGDGTFEGNLFDGLEPKIDPLPHDEAYFKAHLDFLTDYVGRVSDGATSVSTHLIPQVIRLSKPMGAYSPTGPDAQSDEQMKRLASMVEEAWMLADAQTDLNVAGMDPNRTAFVIFHAGIGRDIELTGTTLDRTPEDLPSIFMNTESLNRLLNGRSIQFKGIPVNHTILLPRTETRKGENFILDEPFLAEFSINGMMAASFFNYLGVPDLYDTESGQSAIGPFGLMDPLGIFAYNGLLPPEPSAWTKYYLDWSEPLPICDVDSVDQELSASSLLGPWHTMARICVSSSEYFLIENRYRDPEGDGLKMWVYKDGEIVEQTVTNADTLFNSVTVEGFTGGVLVGADNYDWALPGGRDDQGNELNGGFLIWHVDENIIQETIGENRINADENRRGIDLEEADGAQDLGHPSDSEFGPEADLGSPFDFYYEGNPVSVETTTGKIIHLYTNRFGPDTYPNSNTNQGGPSFVSLEAFSAPAATMRFTFRRVETIDGIEPSIALLFDGTYASGSSLGVRVENWINGLYAVGSDESGVIRYLNPNVPSPDLPQGTVSGRPVRIDESTIGVLTKNEHLFDWSLVRSETVKSIPLPAELEGFELVGAPILSPIESQTKIVFSRQDDPGEPSRLVTIGLAGDAPALPSIKELPFSVAAVAAFRDGLFLVGNEQVQSYIGGVGETRWTYSIADESIGQPVFGKDHGGTIGAIPLKNSGRLLFLLPGGQVLTLEPKRYALGESTEAGLSSYPVLADLDGDARLDVLVSVDSALVAFTQGGAVVNGFPICLKAPAVSQPLVVRFGEEDHWSILIGALNGNIYGYDPQQKGDLRPGFPLSVGDRLMTTPLFDGQTLYVISTRGYVRAWNLTGVTEIGWGQLYGGSDNTSYVELSVEAPPVSNDGALLVEAETYNWPNPIRNGETHLRYLTSKDSRIQITIIDGAGAQVDRIDIERVIGGVPGEYLWQTTAVSGIYYARVKATADDGESDVRIVKMAIIR